MKLSEAIKILDDAAIVSARSEAMTLFAHFGGFSRASLMIGDVECSSEELLLAVRKRATRYPLQYILGEVYFYREVYSVDENCLIPRSDTEVLVDYAVKNIPSGARFLDLCTGSGCVGISTLKNTKNTTAVLVDICDGVLLKAGENAERNGVADRVSLVSLDVMKDVAEGEFFAVLSNPPYVSDSAYEALESEIFSEPKRAFVGGVDGGDFYRHLTPIYKEKIAKSGFIAYEIGYDQADMLREIAKACGMKCQIIKDINGNERVAVLTL